MRLTYDLDAKAAYVYLREVDKVDRTEQLDANLLIDYAGDTPVGVKLLNVHMGVDLDGLPVSDAIAFHTSLTDVRHAIGQIPPGISWGRATPTPRAGHRAHLGVRAQPGDQAQRWSNLGQFVSHRKSGVRVIGRPSVALEIPQDVVGLVVIVVELEPI